MRNKKETEGRKQREGRKRFVKGKKRLSEKR